MVPLYSTGRRRRRSRIVLVVSIVSPSSSPAPSTIPSSSSIASDLSEGARKRSCFSWEPEMTIGGGERLAAGLRGLLRRKRVDSEASGDHLPQLAKELSVPQLTAIGVGSTIGAGVYVLVGTVAREQSGPALTLSFLIAGIASALSAFCYAELAVRCPYAGSAYHYSYIFVGEGIAWLIGWALILEYTIGGSAVARGLSPNLVQCFGGSDSLPSFLARHHIPGLNIVVDPCAAIVVLIVTGLVCVGIKESSIVQGIVTAANACVMIFVIIAGGYIGFQTGWVGYNVPGGYFPYGVDGTLAGSATVFFAYVGFDAIASTAEEVKNPRRDLPLGIGLSLSICCSLYMMVSAVVVGMVPYSMMDPDAPISFAFAKNGMQWAVYVITSGAVLALWSTLMGALIPQPRILMAMARDGLLPSFFSEVNRHTQVPIKGTIFTGLCAAALAFFMDVSQLAEMVSVGTLLAFTLVAVSILILRYVPPIEVPLPSPSLPESSVSASFRDNIQGNGESLESHEYSAIGVEESARLSLILKETSQDKLNERVRRKRAAWSIACVCLGILILTCSASSAFLPNFARYPACWIGGLLLVFSLIVLSRTDQDDAWHHFGLTGGFTCPFVPLLPVCCILINTYLLVNLGVSTWLRVSVWLLAGVLLYSFYGRTHSLLADAMPPPAYADEICRDAASPLR